MKKNNYLRTGLRTGCLVFIVLLVCIIILLSLVIMFDKEFAKSRDGIEAIALLLGIIMLPAVFFKNFFSGGTEEDNGEFRIGGIDLNGFGGCLLVLGFIVALGLSVKFIHTTFGLIIWTLIIVAIPILSGAIIYKCIKRFL